MAQVKVTIVTDTKGLRREIESSLKDLKATVDVSAIKDKLKNLKADVGVKASPESIREMKERLSSALGKVPVGLDLKGTKDLKSVSNTIQAYFDKNPIKIKYEVATGTGNVREAEKAMKAVEEKTKDVGKAAKEASVEVASFGERIGFTTNRLLAYLIPATAFYKATELFSAAKDAIVDLNAEVNKLTQTFDGNADRGKAIAKQVLEISKAYGQNSNELFKTTSKLSRTGLFSDDKQLLETIKKIGQAQLSVGFDNFSDSVDDLGAFLRNFNKTGQDTAHVLDLIAKAASKANVSASTIINSARYGGTSFANAGGSVEDYTAIITSLQQLKQLSPTVTGAGLETIFNNFLRPGNLSVFENLPGANFRDPSGSLKKPLEIFKELAKVTQGMDVEKLQAVLDAAGGTGQAKIISPILKDIQSGSQNSIILKTRQELDNSDGTITKNANIGLERLDVKLQSVAEHFKKVFTDLSQDKSILKLADNFIKLTDAMATILDTAKPLIPVLTQLVAIKAVQATVSSIPDVIRGFRRNVGINGTIGGELPTANGYVSTGGPLTVSFPTGTKTKAKPFSTTSTFFADSVSDSYAKAQARLAELQQVEDNRNILESDYGARKTKEDGLSILGSNQLTRLKSIRSDIENGVNAKFAGSDVTDPRLRQKIFSENPSVYGKLLSSEKNAIVRDRKDIDADIKEKYAFQGRDVQDLLREDPEVIEKLNKQRNAQRRQLQESLNNNPFTFSSEENQQIYKNKLKEFEQFGLPNHLTSKTAAENAVFDIANRKLPQFGESNLPSRLEAASVASPEDIERAKARVQAEKNTLSDRAVTEQAVRNVNDGKSNLRVGDVFNLTKEKNRLLANAIDTYSVEIQDTKKRLQDLKASISKNADAYRANLPEIAELSAKEKQLENEMSSYIQLMRYEEQRAKTENSPLNRLGRAASNVKTKGSAILGELIEGAKNYVLPAVGGLALNALSDSFGQTSLSDKETLASNVQQRISDNRRNSALSAGFSGASTGLLIGSSAGPYGAVAGAVIGGLVGSISSLSESSREASRELLALASNAKDVTGRRKALELFAERNNQSTYGDTAKGVLLFATGTNLSTGGTTGISAGEATSIAEQNKRFKEGLTSTEGRDFVRSLQDQAKSLAISSAASGKKLEIGGLDPFFGANGLKGKLLEKTGLDKSDIPKDQIGILLGEVFDKDTIKNIEDTTVAVKILNKSFENLSSSMTNFASRFSNDTVGITAQTGFITAKNSIDSQLSSVALGGGGSFQLPSNLAQTLSDRSKFLSSNIDLFGLGSGDKAAGARSIEAITAGSLGGFANSTDTARISDVNKINSLVRGFSSNQLSALAGKANEFANNPEALIGVVREKINSSLNTQENRSLLSTDEGRNLFKDVIGKIQESAKNPSSFQQSSESFANSVLSGLNNKEFERLSASLSKLQAEIDSTSISYKNLKAIQDKRVEIESKQTSTFLGDLGKSRSLGANSTQILSLIDRQIAKTNATRSGFGFINDFGRQIQVANSFGTAVTGSGSPFIDSETLSKLTPDQKSRLIGNSSSGPNIEGFAKQAAEAFQNVNKTQDEFQRELARSSNSISLFNAKFEELTKLVGERIASSQKVALTGPRDIAIARNQLAVFQSLTSNSTLSSAIDKAGKPEGLGRLTRQEFRNAVESAKGLANNPFFIRSVEGTSPLDGTVSGPNGQTLGDRKAITATLAGIADPDKFYDLLQKQNDAAKDAKSIEQQQLDAMIAINTTLQQAFAKQIQQNGGKVPQLPTAPLTQGPNQPANNQSGQPAKIDTTVNVNSNINITGFESVGKSEAAKVTLVAFMERLSAQLKQDGQPDSTKMAGSIDNVLRTFKSDTGKNGK